MVDRDEHLIESGDSDGLGNDSGYLTVVDASRVDDFLDAEKTWWDGTEWLPPAGRFANGGAVINLDGADVYPWGVRLVGGAVEVVEIVIDDAEPDMEWTLLGQVPVTSGVLLVGAPEMVKDYVPYPLESVVDARGVWLALSMPNGWVDVTVARWADSGEPRRVQLTPRPG